MVNLKYYSYGSTTAVITSLAIIVGFSNTANAVINIITALIIIAVADNISDSLGIHIHQESEASPPREVMKVTYINFAARLLVTMMFILILLLVKLPLAVYVSMFAGFSVIVVLSYFIAKKQNIRPYKSIINHLLITVLVIVISFLLREWIANVMPKLVKVVV